MVERRTADWRQQLLPDVVAIIAICALSLVLMGPVIWHFNTWLYGIGGDGPSAPEGIAQRLDSARQGGILAPLQALLGAPFPYQGDGEVAAPLWFYTGALLATVLTPIGATNALILLSFLLTGGATYALLRREGLHPGPALLGAVVFGFAPTRVAQAQEHFGMLDEFWLVLECGLLLALLRRLTPGPAIALGLCIALTELDNPYLGYFAGVLAGTVLLVYLARFLLRRDGAGLFRLLVLSLMALAAIVVVVVPTQFQLFVQAHAVGQRALGADSMVRDLGELDRLSLRWWNFFLPFPYNPILGPLGRAAFFAHLGVDTVTEQSTMPGYTALLLALGGLIVALRRTRATGRKPLAAAVTPVAAVWGRARTTFHGESCPARAQAPLWSIAILCIITGILFGMPPFLDIGPLRVLTPPAFAHTFFPEIRTTSRIAVVIQLGVALLAASGAAALLDRQPSPRRRQLALAGLLALILVEYVNVPPWRSVPLLPAPAFYQWLERTPLAQTGIVVQYPIAPSDMARTPLYAFYAYAVHHHPLFNGVVRDTPADALRTNLEDLLNPTTPSAWAALGVRTVALDRTYLAPLFGNAGLRWPADFQRRLPAGLTVAFQGSPWEAYHVASAPARVVAGLGAGVGDAALEADGREWHWVGRGATIWLDNVTGQPARTAVWTAVHNNGPSHALQLGATASQVASSAQAATAIALVATVPPGMHAYALTVNGPATPLKGSGDRTPVSVQLRSLEPAPVAPLDAAFDEGGRPAWTLEGVSLDACRLAAGSPLDAALLWRVDAPTTRAETVFLHLVNANGAMAAQDDSPPNHGAVDTSRLAAGARVVDIHTIPTATDLPPGRYRLLAGLYDRQTGARLKLANEADTVELGVVTITPVGAGPQRTPCSW